MCLCVSDEYNEGFMDFEEILSYPHKAFLYGYMGKLITNFILLLITVFRPNQLSNTLLVTDK